MLTGMAEQGAFGDRLGSRFGVPDVPVAVTRLHKTQVAVTLIESTANVSVMSEPLPPEDAYLVHLNLLPCPGHELWMDGRSLGKRTFLAGETAIHDVRRNPTALIHTPMGSLMFYLSQGLLNELCDDANAPQIGELQWHAGDSLLDPVIRSLGESISYAMVAPGGATPLFVDHVTLALAVHVAETYGGMRTVRARDTGRLAPWQERRAKELLTADLSIDVPLLELASACGLSVSHFTRLFTRSVGEPPHKWLLRHRVEKAKALLRANILSLAEVGLTCGFCDQSHFTRCFRRMARTTPGAWRQHHKN
jgi:AraC-like DNA-binding protein